MAPIGVIGALAVIAAAYALYWHGLPEPTNADVILNAQAVVDDEDARTLVLVPKTPPTEAVIYVHGNGQDERTLLTGRNVAPMAAELLRAGYLVAAAEAGGSSWGSEGSVDAYVSFIELVRADFGVRNVYLVAESMGGLVAFQAAARADVTAIAALYPVCDLSTLMDQPDIAEGVGAAFPDGIPRTVSPVSVPRVPTIIWASPEDARVPMDSNAEACASQHDDVQLVRTSGQHGDSSNFDSEALIAFFESASLS